jgi:hypothetical protein
MWTQRQKDRYDEARRRLSLLNEGAQKGHMKSARETQNTSFEEQTISCVYCLQTINKYNSIWERTSFLKKKDTRLGSNVTKHTWEI